MATSVFRVIEWKIVLLLSIIPAFREIIMGLFFSHHGSPFATPKDIIHTILEMGFMFAVGVAISRIRFSRQTALQQKEHLEKMVNDRTEEIRLTQQTSIEALATLSEYHNTDTGDHIRRIRSYVGVLALWLKNNSGYGDYLNQRPDYVEDLSLAAILHDIGKNAVPEKILAKPGKLTAEEFDVMKTHTSIAGEIFKNANQLFVECYDKDSYLALACDIANCHHEHGMQTDTLMDFAGKPFHFRPGSSPLLMFMTPWSAKDPIKNLGRMRTRLRKSLRQAAPSSTQPLLLPFYPMK